MYEIRTLGLPPPIPTRQQVLQQSVTEALSAVGLETHPTGTWNVTPGSFDELVRGILRIGNSLAPAYEYNYFEPLEVEAELRQRGYVTGEERPPMPRPNGGPGAEDTLPPLQQPPPGFPLWLILLGLGVFAFAGRDNKRKRKSQGQAATLSAIPADQYLLLSGEGCRDAEGKFIPVPQCVASKRELWQMSRTEAEAEQRQLNRKAIEIIKAKAEKFPEAHGRYVPKKGRTLSDDIATRYLAKKDADRYKQLMYFAHKAAVEDAISRGKKVSQELRQSVGLEGTRRVSFLSGEGCRDADGKFIPVAQCTGRLPKKAKKPAKKPPKAKVPQIRIVNPDEDLGKKPGYRVFLVATRVPIEEGGVRTLDAYERVLGKPVTVPGFEAGRFFVHLDLEKVKAYPWSVSEATTGSALARYGSATQKKAVESVKETFSKHGITEQKLKETLAKTAKIWDTLPKAQVPEHLRLSGLSGEGCRDAEGNFIPTWQCTGRPAPAWALTQDQYLRKELTAKALRARRKVVGDLTAKQYKKREHEKMVRQAFIDGKKIRPAVLKDYPHLKPEPPKKKPKKPKTAITRPWEVTKTAKQLRKMEFRRSTRRGERDEAYVDWSNPHTIIRGKDRVEAYPTYRSSGYPLRLHSRKEILTQSESWPMPSETEAKEAIARALLAKKPAKKPKMPKLPKRPDKSPAFGKRYTDPRGQTWELVAQNDVNVPYFSKVTRGKVGKRQYTHADGEARARALLAEKPAKKPPKAKVVVKPSDLNADEWKVLQAFKGEKIHIDEVARRTKLPPYKVSAALVMLELKSLAHQSVGKMFEATVGKVGVEKPKAKKPKMPKAKFRRGSYVIVKGAYGRTMAQGEVTEIKKFEPPGVRKGLIKVYYQVAGKGLYAEDLVEKALPGQKPMKRKKQETFWIWKGTGVKTGIALPTIVLTKKTIDPETDMPVGKIIESAKKGEGTLWMVTATDPMDAHHELSQAQKEPDQRRIEKMDKNIFAVKRSPEQWKIIEAQRPTSLAKGLEVKEGQDVEFQTPGGLRKTGTVSTIIEGKVYVVPDGAQHSIPVKYISRIIPVRRKGAPVLKGSFLMGTGCRDEDGKFIPTWQCTGRPRPKNVWDFLEKTPRQITYKAKGHEGLVIGDTKKFSPTDQKHISEIFNDTREVLKKYRRIRNYYGFTKETLKRENLRNPHTNIVHDLIPFDRYFGMGSSGIDRRGIKFWWYSPKLSRQATEKLKQMVEATPPAAIAHEVTHTIGSTRELIDPLGKAVGLRFYLRHPYYVSRNWLDFEVETVLRQGLGKAKPYNIEAVKAVYEANPKYVDNILEKWLAPKDQERLRHVIK